MSFRDALKKKKNILHLIIWILSLAALGLIAGLTCFKCSDNFCENQFIDATVFGFFVVSCILLVGTFCEEDIPPKPALVLCFLGAVLYLVTSILLFLFLNKTYFGSSNTDDIKGRSMGAMIVCLLTGLLYLLEFIIAITKPDLLE